MDGDDIRPEAAKRLGRIPDLRRIRCDHQVEAVFGATFCELVADARRGAGHDGERATPRVHDGNLRD